MVPEYCNFREYLNIALENYVIISKLQISNTCKALL